MASEVLRGNQTVSGAYGTVWVDNEKIAEVKKFESKVTANRVDVQLGLSVDSKIVGLKGEGSFEVSKVYSRAKTIFESWKKGNDKRARIVVKIADPDSPGKQEERVSFDNVWFNEVSLAAFTKGEAVGETFPFGFTPEDAEFEGAIK